MKIQVPLRLRFRSGTGVRKKHPSLVKPITLTEGEIVEKLEHGGPVALSSLLERSCLPMPLVLMGVGALVRDRLVHETEPEERELAESLA